MIATAGHVDHGKSTLVCALTGVDPDRLAEEKRSGRTITLGFAEMNTESAVAIGFVDVPGHERLIKTMLAGVGAIDGVMFVVDAAEGWRAQSEEHLRILDLLRVRRGLVVLTKCGRVDSERLELVEQEVGQAISDTTLASAPILAVDAISGYGMSSLRLALAALADSLLPPVDTGRARLWIDRSFALAGSGTVVTGSLAGGTIRKGDAINLVTAKRTVKTRIRRLQSFGRDKEIAAPGSRVAVNLASVHHREIRRGSALVELDRWHHTRRFDASLIVLASAGGPVRSRAALAIHIGSAELAIRLRVIRGAEVGAGEAGLVRVDLPRALPLSAGDRFIVRDIGRARTVAGGEVLDLDPVLPTTKARPDRSIDRVIAERGWIDSDQLERLTGERRQPTVGRWLVDPLALDRERHNLVERVESSGVVGLDVSVLDERSRAVLRATPIVEVVAGRARLTGEAEDPRERAFLAALADAPFAPPHPTELSMSASGLSDLVRRGLVIKQDGIIFADASVDLAAVVVDELLAKTSSGVTVAEVRLALQTSRKYALPLLSLLDARGYTRRRGDVRVPGPRERSAHRPDGLPAD